MTRGSGVARTRGAMARVSLCVLFACALVPQGSGVAGALPPTIVEYPVPSSGSPFGIAPGSDGNLWYVERDSNKVGRVTTSGSFMEFPIPSSSCQTCPSSFAEGIAPGPDGRLWFTEHDTNRIGRVTTSGTFKEFTVPTANSLPTGIAAGPDGRLWFTEQGANKIGRITTSGSFKEFTIPTAGSTPVGIAAGSDGNLWFTEWNANQIGRVSTGGAFKEFSIPTPDTDPAQIAADPDGNLWFTEADGNQIGRITTSGTVTEFPIPTSISDPEGGITAGPDGNVWFTETLGNNIGKTSQPNLNILHVSYIPNFFVKKVAPLANQGETVSWLMMSPGTHGIADSSGLHLFGFGPAGGPSPVGMGQTFAFAFDWAGTFSYNDPFHTASSGQVKVPLSVSKVVGAVGEAAVTWASEDAPAGDGFDVQVKGPGASSFTDWRTGVSTLSDVFGPSDPLWVGPGKYAFRARLTQLPAGAAGGYSSSTSISLS